jgi:hypothetical protein
LVGPAHLNGQPVSVNRSIIDDAGHASMRLGAYAGKPTAVDIHYPTRSLYRQDQARHRSTPPTDAERAADRAGVTTWAQTALADPATVILEIGTMGDIDAPCGTPQNRAASCELAVCDASGALLLNTLVNPEWEELPAADLAAHQVTARQLRAAPPFHQVRRHVTKLLAGRRVICIDRARTYGVLFCDLEWCVTGRWYWVGDDNRILTRGPHPSSARRSFIGECWPNGSLATHAHHEILDILDTARFECARLASSRFIGAWDDQHRPVLADRLAEPYRAADRARATLDALKRMSVDIASVSSPLTALIDAR